MNPARDAQLPLFLDGVEERLHRRDVVRLARQQALGQCRLQPFGGVTRGGLVFEAQFHAIHDGAQ